MPYVRAHQLMPTWYVHRCLGCGTKGRSIDLKPEQKHPTLSGWNSYTLGEAAGGTGKSSVEALAQVQFWDWKKDDITNIERLGYLWQRT